MRALTPDLHVLEQPQRFLGLELGARMSVLRLDGGLLVHAPVAVDPAVAAALGPIRWVVAPNLFHHLHVAPWLDVAHEAWAAPGLAAKRPDLRFDGVLGAGASPFGDEVHVVPLKGIALTREVVLLHRPSRTLIVTDLLFNLSDRAPWATRAAFWCMGGYPGCRATVVERLAMDRAVARRDILGLLELDFDRIVLAHGDVVERGGRDALARAFAWLL